ncbi:MULTISPECIES: hypothetical protein [Pseudomonas]|uniref:hypothetical protein n=1 Tax=Pseudomonas TaxID=286 RepID=UPI000AF2B0ED|nr:MULTISPECIES: hypothetical protein [Pseudomonas]WIN05142.1 hypothetical protein QQF68_16140 [Pseudomonas syringae pv. antirrhini str. 126]
MAFKLQNVTVTHITNGEIIGVAIVDVEKHASINVQIKPSKPYEQLTLGEILNLAVKEASSLTAC